MKICDRTQITNASVSVTARIVLQLVAQAPLMDCSTFCPGLAEVRKDGHWNSLAVASSIKI